MSLKNTTHRIALLALAASTIGVSFAAYANRSAQGSPGTLSPMARSTPRAYHTDSSLSSRSSSSPRPRATSSY